MNKFFLLATLTALLGLTGCKGDDASATTDMGVSTDLGTGGDTGVRDLGARDATVDAGSDPCVADSESASDTIGCNGTILGPSVPDNAFGGRCTIVDPEDATGTCTEPDNFCFVAVDGMPGYCSKECPRPEGTAYVSTGGCPSGSRCFELQTTDPIGQCFVDCEVQEDCLSVGEGYWCDSDGSCEPPPPPAEEDAGIPEVDGSVTDAATPTPDADTTDAGTLDDAGIAEDTGVPPA